MIDSLAEVFVAQNCIKKASRNIDIFVGYRDFEVNISVLG